MYDPFMNQNENNQNQDMEKQETAQTSAGLNSTAPQDNQGGSYYSQSYSQNYSQPNGYNAPNKSDRSHVVL